MELEDIRNTLYTAYKVCDTAEGWLKTGIVPIPLGEISVRDMLRYELVKFMAYMAYANGNFSDMEFTLMNYVMEDNNTPEDYKKIFPVEKLATPSENSALLVSSYLDAKLKQKNISKEDKVYANTAIKIFDAIGEIMEFMDQDNQAAHEYRERYMADMRTLANYIFQKESK